MSTDILEALKAASNGIIEWEKGVRLAITAGEKLQEAIAEIHHIEEAEAIYRESRNFSDDEPSYERRPVASSGMSAARSELAVLRQQKMVAENVVEELRARVKHLIGKAENLIKENEKCQ